MKNGIHISKRLICCSSIFILMVVMGEVCFAQTIDSILVIGNKRTKEPIVINELFFRAGDEVDDRFMEKIEHSEAALMRLKIFTEAKISVIHKEGSDGQNLIVEVKVKELWPLYPIPKFDILDRSYTVWIKEHSASLDRVLYGINLTHINTTGRADQLNFDWQSGFQQRGKLEYQSPPLTKDQKLRMNTRVEYSANKDIDVGITDDNELIRLRDNENLLTEWNYGSRIIYRHTNEFSIMLDANFTHLNYADTINSVNPIFYASDLNWHDKWQFKLVYDSRSNVVFATRGNRIEVEYVRTGLIQNKLGSHSFKANWIQTYMFPGNKSGVRNEFRLGIRDWGRENYYYFQKSVSRELSDLRAYETAFIPGNGYAMNRLKVYQLLLNRKYRGYPKFIKKYVPEVPYQLYLSLNYDMAYIRNYDENVTELNNKWLYSWGPSLEFVFFNNFRLSIDYSLDRENQGVFNVNFDTSF